MRWLMAGAGLVLVVVGASFSPAWQRAAPRPAGLFGWREREREL